MEPTAQRREPGVDARFRDLYRSTLPAVYGFVSYRTGGDRALAEDIIAETYAAAVAHIRSGREREVDLSWLKTVAKRRLIDHWRRAGTAADKIVLLVDRRSSAEHDASTRPAVVAALGALAESQRAALVLQAVEGHSVAEIAEVLDRSPKAVESLLARARESFRSAYAKEVARG